MIDSRLYLQKVFFVVGVFVLFLGIIDANAIVVSQNDSIFGDEMALDSAILDSIGLPIDGVGVDSLGVGIDSVGVDSATAPRKDVLDAEVQYQARDSIVFFMDGTPS